MAENIDTGGPQFNFIEHDGPQREREPEPPVSDEGAVPVRPSVRVRSAPEAPFSDDYGYTTHPLESPPESVGKRYLRAANRYFLKDEPHRLAFEDRGPRIATEHNRPDIAESMVEMAQAKGWRRIRVSGHDDFKREAWLVASLHGIAVAGYMARPVDQARLNDLRQTTMTNWVEPEQKIAAAHDNVRGTSPPASMDEPVVAHTSGQRAGRTSRAAPSDAAVGEGQAGAAVWSGKLSEYGSAPYQHDPENSASYYAIYRDQRGVDHTVWGVDLERAIGESGAGTGDVIQLESLGRRWVKIEAPVRSEAGTIIDVEDKQVYRNSWQVDVIGQDKAREPAAVTPETGTPVTARRAAVRSMANLDKAESTVALPARQRAAADHAASRKPSSQPRGAQLDRARSPASRASSPDPAVHLSVIAEAMREQGFSEQSVAKVQARATRMLKTFQTLGAEVPLPRAYDVNASATRGRRRPQSDGAAHTLDQVRPRPEPSAPSAPSLPRL